MPPQVNLGLWNKVKILNEWLTELAAFTFSLIIYVSLELMWKQSDSLEATEPCIDRCSSTQPATSLSPDQETYMETFWWECSQISSVNAAVTQRNPFYIPDPQNDES